MTTLLAPERTYEQRMDALRIANEVRFARAELKRRLRDGTLTAAQVLLSPPDCMLKMGVHELLCAQRGIGPSSARRFLNRCQISGSRTVCGLSSRQREALAMELTA